MTSTCMLKVFWLLFFYLVTLFSSEQCSPFETFHLQHVQMVNKTISSKQNLLAIVDRGALTFPLVTICDLSLIYLNRYFGRTAR